MSKSPDSQEIPTGALMGRKAIESNILAAMDIASKIKTTYGPKGRDKMLVVRDGTILISNDGATILKHLKSSHPIAQMLVDLSKTQDELVGDGTTSIVLFTSCLLKEALDMIRMDTKIDDIIEGFEIALEIAMKALHPISIEKDVYWSTMKKLLCVPFHSKLLFHDRDFFSDLVMQVMQNVKNFDRSSLRIVRVPGGSLRESTLIQGVVFPRPFSYAGFEQQEKRIERPKILLLNHEIELKHMGENTKIVIKNATEYSSFVQEESNLVMEKIRLIQECKADVIIDTQVIGDVATQKFTQSGIINLSRVSGDVVVSLSQGLGVKVQSFLTNLNEKCVGTCDLYEERTIGDSRFCILSGFQNPIYTLILRGGSDQVIEEAERSLNDSICVGANVFANPQFLLGGGSVEMTVAQAIRRSEIDVEFKTVTEHYAKALDAMVSTLIENCRMKPHELLPMLKKIHNSDVKDASCYGIDVNNKKVVNMHEIGIYEPYHAKKNILTCATETAITILTIDCLIKMPQEETDEERSVRIAEELKKRKAAERKWKEIQSGLKK